MATTHTVDKEYRNPAYEAVNFENIAVIVLVEDRSERIANESVIAERLSALAVNASATFHFMPNILTVESDAAAREALSHHNH